MKSLLLIFGVAFLITPSMGQSNSRQPNLDSLKELEFKRLMNLPTQLNGTKYEPLSLLFEKAGSNNYDLKNKVCFINLWFASCAPCISEIKGLNALYKKLENNPGFRFISFTFENQATIEKFREEYNIAYESISVTMEDCKNLTLSTGFPFNILIDQNGIINGVYMGSLGNETQSSRFFAEKILPKIEEVLAKSKNTEPSAR